jgi:hypothetical protein
MRETNRASQQRWRARHKVHPACGAIHSPVPEMQRQANPGSTSSCCVTPQGNESCECRLERRGTILCAVSQVRMETNAEQLERLTAEMEQMHIQQVPAPLSAPSIVLHAPAPARRGYPAHVLCV